jgi:diguanylate cyclase (GGDEF)-like protein
MVEATLSEPVSWRGRRRRLALGFGALLVLAGLFAAIVVNAVSADRYRREAESWYLHTFEMLVAVERLRATANMAIRGERGYLITGDEKFLASYNAARAETPKLLARLREETRDNPAQQQHLAVLDRRIASYNSVLERAIALRRAGREADAVALVRSGAGRHEIEGVLAALDTIQTEENALLAQRSAENERANALIADHYYSLAGVGFAFLLVAAAAGISTAGAQKRVRLVAEQLRISATTDVLTGLVNRRSFMQTLDVELARARRNGAPLSVAIADIDYFKRINDTHGHAGGDEVLCRVAEIATDTMRMGDVVARLGGEEFAILMPDTDEDQARIACERLRAALAARPVRLSTGADAPVTLSTGVALLVPGEDKDRLVTRADNALYRAKSEGRNQVRMAA